MPVAPVAVAMSGPTTLSIAEQIAASRATPRCLVRPTLAANHRRMSQHQPPQIVRRVVHPTCACHGWVARDPRDVLRRRRGTPSDASPP